MSVHEKLQVSFQPYSEKLYTDYFWPTDWSPHHKRMFKSLNVYQNLLNQSHLVIWIYSKIFSKREMCRQEKELCEHIRQVPVGVRLQNLQKLPGRLSENLQHLWHQRNA